MTQDDIQKFIDEDINPGLEMHGGFLAVSEFDVEAKVLKVMMGGGCQGCASSTITLKLMINNALREEFPELAEIEDVTDHQAGANPFYA